MDQRQTDHKECHITDRPAEPLKGVILSLAAFSLWACGDALVKYLGRRESIYALGFWTEIVVIAILLIVGLSGKMGTLRHAVLNPHLKWYVLRGALVFVQFMSGMYCFIHMELAKAYTLIFTAPLLTALLAFMLMKEAVGMVKSLAIALGFTGVLIVLRPGLIPLDVPSVMALTSALTFALSNLTARHAGLKPGGSALGLVLVAELVVLAATVPLYFAHFSLPPVPDLLWIAVIGALGITGFFCLTHAFTCAPAAVVAPYHYIQMLWALIFGSVFFNEMPDRYTGPGAAIIIASGLWLIRQERITSDPLPEILAPAAEE
jgi:S-adenosylmethionine uptake transporter